MYRHGPFFFLSSFCTRTGQVRHVRIINRCRIIHVDTKVLLELSHPIESYYQKAVS